MEQNFMAFLIVPASQFDECFNFSCDMFMEIKMLA